MRIHFVGTDYAPPPLGRDWALPVAKAEGIEGFVQEHRYRVPYFDSLYYLTHADALIAVGSNDPTYSASKIFPYVLARRPMLLVFHAESPVLTMARAMKCGQCYPFRETADIDTLASKVSQEWFLDGKMSEFVEADLSAFQPYSAESMTKRLAKCFNAALGINQQRT